MRAAFGKFGLDVAGKTPADGTHVNWRDCREFPGTCHEDWGICGGKRAQFRLRCRGFFGKICFYAMPRAASANCRTHSTCGETLGRKRYDTANSHVQDTTLVGNALALKKKSAA